MNNFSTHKQLESTYRSHILVLIGIILTSLNLRAAVTSLSDIFTEVSKDINGFDISFMGILPLLSFAIFGAVAPTIKNKLGFEKSLFISMFLVGIGLLLRSMASNFEMFIVESIIALAGMGFGNVLLPPLFKKYFPNHTGVITSLYSVLIAVSAGFPSILSANTINAVGWRVDIGLWAMVGFAAAIPWFLQILINPDVTKPDHLENEKFPSVYKWKQAWAMAILFGVGGMLPMYTLINWLPTYLEQKGLSIQVAGMTLFLYNTIGIIHSFVIPLIIGRFKHPFLLILLAFILQLAGYVGFMFEYEHAYVWAVIAAPGLLAVPAVFQLFNLRSRTAQGATHLSSFVQFIGYLFAVAGPIFFGKLEVLSNGYTAPFVFLIIMSFIMLFAGFFAVKSNYIEDGN